MKTPPRILTTLVTAVTASSLFLTGCVTTGGGTLGALGYDHQERKIINQATGVGAGVGAAAGYAIARNNSRSDSSRVAGTILGGLAGAAAGHAIGRGQANKARSVRLSNEQMRDVLAEVRSNNDRLIAYNRKVDRRIAEIKKADKDQQAALAKAELGSVDKAIKETDKMIEQNESDANLLAGSQQSDLIRENRKAKSQRADLVANRNELATIAAR
jgi:uncharacterized protein YcfJ